MGRMVCCCGYAYYPLAHVRYRPQRYEAFHLDEAFVHETIDQIMLLIELSEWLAKEAQEELIKYLEFAKWFRSGGWQ